MKNQDSYWVHLTQHKTMIYKNREESVKHIKNIIDRFIIIGESGHSMCHWDYVIIDTMAGLDPIYDKYWNKEICSTDYLDNAKIICNALNKQTEG